MLLSKNEDRTFDELTEQLCMFEINFIKAQNGDITVQEAVAVSRLKKIQNKDTNFKFIEKLYKRDICNYCNRSLGKKL